MDINTIRGLATLIALIAFLSVVFWAYSGRRKDDFKEAAEIPFADDQKTVDNNVTENSQTRGVKQ